AADGADQAGVQTIPDGKVLAAAIAAARQAAAAGDGAEAEPADEQATPAGEAEPAKAAEAKPAAASCDTSLETAVRAKPKAAPPRTAWTTPRVTVKPQGPAAPMTA